MIGHLGSVWTLALLENGQLVSGSRDQTIKIWNTASGVVLNTLSGHTNEIVALAVLPNNCLASGARDSTIKIWDTSEARIKMTITDHMSEVLALIVWPVTHELVSASRDETIKIFY